MILSLSAYSTRLSQALVGSVDPVCPGLTAPGALPLAQRLRLPPGPTTVVAPTPKPYVAWAPPVIVVAFAATLFVLLARCQLPLF